MDHGSESSEGTSEECPICLRALKTQEIGTPETCEHRFCVKCLQEWAKIINTCPVDRQTFTRILVRRHLNGSVSRRIAVAHNHDDHGIVEDRTYCETCQQSDREDRMLLCDGCDNGYHLECLNPPLFNVPVEQWFCPECVDDDDDIVEDATFCEACQQGDREDRLLLCDGCDNGYHLECLNPPLFNVPVEQWFCQECVLSNSMDMLWEGGVGAVELIDLTDADNTSGSSPLRPSSQRLQPRTRASVRHTIRVRERTEEVNLQSTSSGIASQESADRLTGFFAGRSLLGSKKTPTKRKILPPRRVAKKTKVENHYSDDSSSDSSN